MGKTGKRLLTILLAAIMLATALALVACEQKEVNIDHIEIYSAPKSEYYIGESLDLTDARILVAYKNNTDKLVDITPSMISDYDPYTLGEQYIRVYYSGHSATMRVTVKRYDVVSVELSIPSENFDYIVEQNLRTDNSYLILHYANDTEDRIPITEAMCSGYDPYVIGQQTVTVTYVQDGNTYSGVYSVNVEDKELVGIEVTVKPTQSIYYLGDSDLDLSGGELFLKYNNGYSVRMPMTDADGVIDGLEAEWDNSVVDSDSKVTLTYGGFSTVFTVDVQYRDVSYYELIGTIPTQMQNLPLDLGDVYVTIGYTNGEVETVPLAGDRVEVRGYDAGAPGTQQLTLAFYYGGVELSFTSTVTVTVEARTPVGLEIVEPAPVIYQDTAFDIGDWQYRIVYSNGERGEAAALTDSLIKWDNNVPVTSYPEAGVHQWYIYVDEGVELDYEFEVVALEVVNIVFNGAENVIAYFGGQALVDGVTMTVTYNSGTVVNDVPLDPNAVRFDNTVTGNQLATVVYTDKYETDGYEAPLYVTVIKEIAKVDVSGDFKTDYYLNSSFDPEGMTLYVVYSDNSVETVSESDVNFYDNWSFRSEKEEGGALVFTHTGEQKVYLINGGLNFEVFVTVNVSNDFVELKGLYRSNDGVYVPVSGEFSAMTVVQGNALELEGYYILVEFEGESVYIPVTADMTDYNARNTTVGERSVSIYYADDEGNVFGQCDFVITVVAKSVTGIEITQLPDKLIYVAGNSSATLDLTGIVVRLVYDNGTYDTIDNSDLLQSGFEYNEEGEQTITISYIGDSVVYSDTFTIDVLGKSPSSLSWVSSTVPIADLAQGSEFDFDTVYVLNDSGSYLTSLSMRNVVIQYDNGDTDIVTIGDIREAIKVTDYNSTSIGKQYVTLNYLNGTYLNVEVNVLVRKLASIELANSSGEPFTVIQGAAIDLGDLKLIRVFEDETTSTIPAEASFINYDATLNPGGYNALDPSTGERKVTVRYVYGAETEAKYCEVTFIVLEKSLTGVEIFDIPKQKYIENEPFDQNTGSVIAYYDNGDTEILYFATASVNIPTATFNIDTANFDNSEFSGLVSKTQRITVSYEYNGVRKSTGYNIYMRDRRNAETRFDEGNVYGVTYGTRVSLQIALYGYATYDSQGADTAFDEGSYLVEYIPEEVWNSVGREEGADYTAIPVYAGVYRIVVTYAGDAIHNALLDASRTVTIAKKPVTLGIVGVDETSAASSMIYGAAVPDILVTVRETGGAIADDPFSAFAYDDTFTSNAFNSAQGTYATVYLADKNGNKYLDADGNYVALTVFDMIYSNAAGTQITVSELTGVGRYTLGYRADAIVSDNYEITFETAIFTVGKRPVRITPSDVRYTYGSQMPEIPYVASALDGDADSGICNGDILAGALSKSDSGNTAVGEYAVTLGSLASSNPNYTFVLDEAKITIVPRDIYVKSDSTDKVYGEELIVPAVRFYGDAACEDVSGAFAPGDDSDSLGVFEIDCAVDKYTAVGQYGVTAKLVSEGEAYANYTIHFISGTVNVAQRPVSVTPESEFKYYGEPETVIRYTVSAIPGNAASGLITNAEGEIETLTGALGRIEGEESGEYSVTIGTLGAGGNYAVSLVSAKYLIKPKELKPVFTEDELTKYYDGKAPSLTANTVYYKTYSGEYALASAEELAVFNSLLSYGFANSSKNSGSYQISVSVSNANYTATFGDGVNYSYVILKRPFSVTADDYVDLPDGREYTGSAFILTAKVSEEYLQPVYNADGVTQATDDDGNPVFDNVDLTLSISSVTAAGTYTVEVLSVVDQNYELIGNEEVTFTILPKSVYIEINCNSSELPDTLEREFDNQAAYIYTTDYVLKDSTGAQLTAAEVPQFSLGITLNGVVVEARDVRYDADGQVVGYDISIVSTSSDSNYKFILAKEYQFRIVPKAVTITIYEQYLNKTYDGKEPSLSTGMFSVMPSGVNTASVVFTFVRNENDGRDNSSVGNYSVGVDCLDRNYTVSLYSTYEYSIEKVNISVSVQATALSKIYDGNGYSFAYSNLNLGAYVGNAPIVRNFSIPAGTLPEDPDSSYSKFLKDFNTLSDTLDQLKANYGYVDFNDTGTATNFLTETRSYATTLSNYVTQFAYFLQQNSVDRMSSATSVIDSRCLSALDALSKGEIVNARTHYEYCASYVNDLIAVMTAESSYIAFVFEGDAEGATANAGTYTFTVYPNDFNRNFNMIGNAGTVTVNSRTLQIYVDDIAKNYGTEITSIPYKIKDPRSGEFIESGLNVIGVPVSEGMPADAVVGVYGIVTSDMFIAVAGSDSEEDPNYNLIVGSIGSLTVNRAKITVVLDDVSGDNYVYGTQIRKSSLDKKGYSYVNIDDVTEGSELGQLALLHGAGNTFEEKKLDYFGKLQGGDTADIIISDYVVFYCYVNGESGAEIFDSTTASAGDYVLTASGFSTVGNNYTIQVISGTFTIAKAPLSVSVGSSGNINKVYGEEGVTLNYLGFQNNDAASNVYVKAEDGSVVTLSNMKWAYSVQSAGAADPMLATTDVTGTPVAIKFNDAGYTLDNYTMNFSVNVNVLVVKATLTLSVKPTDVANNGVVSYYRGVPAENSYYYTYSGFKNGQTAEEFDIVYGGANAPELITANGSAYYNAGTYTFGADNMNLASADAALSNYDLVVAQFNYIVNPLTIRVTLDTSDIATVLYASENNRVYDFSPYIAEVKYHYESVNNSQGETVQYNYIDSMNIVGGQYGQSNFKLNIYYPAGAGIKELSDSEAEALYAKISMMGTSSGVIYDNDTDSRTEYYRYNEMYQHGLTLGAVSDIDRETHTVECKLNGMFVSDTNFKFEYVPFEVKVYDTVAGLLADIEEKLLASDLAKTDAQIRELIKVTAYDTNLNDLLGGNGTANSEGITVSGNIPDATDITSVLRLTYLLEYTLGTPITDGKYLTYTYTDPSNAQHSVTVSDNRVLTYTGDSVYSDIAIRFYDETTTVYGENELDIKKKADGSGVSEDYVVGTLDDPGAGTSYLANGKFGYDRGLIEFRVLPANVAQDTRVRIVLNGDYASGEYLYAEFAYGDYNSLTIGYKTSSFEYFYEYALNYGSVFDGKTHEVKFMLDTEFFTLLLSVDGKVGAVYDLNDLDNDDKNSIFGAGNTLESRSDYGAYVVGSAFAIREIECYSQGLYDKSGTFISLKANSDSIVFASSSNEYCAATVQLASFFGLPSVLPEGYEALFYIDGEGTSYGWDDSITLTRGRHKVELALYYDNGTSKHLIDYDMLIVTVDKAREISAILMYKEDGSDYVEYHDGIAYDLYAVDGTYTGNAIDKSLVRLNGAATGQITGIDFKGEGYETSYLSTVFDLVRTATVNADNTAVYPAGTGRIDYYLFSDGSTENGVNIYLRFNIEQTSEEVVGTNTYDYNVSVELHYTVYDGQSYVLDLDNLKYTGNATLPTYAINAYRDRNSTSYGTNNYAVAVTLVGVATETYVFADEVGNRDAFILNGFDASNAPRMVFHTMTLEERLPEETRDYLVIKDGVTQWVANRASGAEIAAGSTVTVNDGFDLPKARAGDTQTWKYSSAATSGELNFRFNESVWETSSTVDGIADRGAYLRYDIASNTFYFGFHYDNIASVEQAWQPTSEWNGKVHTLTLRLTTDLTELLSTTSDVMYNDGTDTLKALTDSKGANLYYQEISVTYDGETHIFYCPQFGDMGLWKAVREDGSEYVYGSSNKYSEITDLNTTPTFLALYRYSRLETGADITLYGVSGSYGADNGRTDAFVTKQPII